MGEPTAWSHPGSASSRRSRLVVLAVATTLSLGSAEVGLRIFSPQLAKLRQLVEPTGDERGFAPKPGTRLDFNGVFEPLTRPIVWQTNADGFRDDHEVGPPNECFRVATYGDSETFGWSVALEDTFQRQMEAIDPRVEVLNFGVPGYQVVNIRKQLERSLPRFQPDLAIYLVNKNDFNKPPQVTLVSRSHLLLHVHFFWHFTIGKRIRLATREGPDRLEMFANEVDRMTRVLEERDTPFVLAFLRWRNREALRDYVPRGSERFRREYVNVAEVIDGEPKEDIHYAASAHRKMAALFCRAISGAPEGSCIPPGWRREGRPGRVDLAGAPRS
jgi:hypothetical protein